MVTTKKTATLYCYYKSQLDTKMAAAEGQKSYKTHRKEIAEAETVIYISNCFTSK